MGEGAHGQLDSLQQMITLNDLWIYIKLWITNYLINLHLNSPPIKRVSLSLYFGQHDSSGLYEKGRIFSKISQHVLRHSLFS